MKKSMINKPISITNAGTLSDGGTKYLIGNDHKGNEFSILLAQYVIPDNFDPTQIPGRLHFNDNPIDIRSNIEKDLIKSLEGCLIKVDSTALSFSKGLEEIKDSKNLMEAHKKGSIYGVAYLIKYIIDFVQSNNYVEISKDFNRNT